MRYLLVVLASFTLLISSNMVFAQEVKIGVVNIGLLLENAPQAKAASQTLEKEFAPQQNELSKLARKMESKQKEFQKNKLILSESQRLAKERELNMLNRDIQRKKNDIQELVNIRRNEELANLQTVVNQAIKSIGKQEKYDLILYEGIAYTNNRVDVTKQILDYLNAEYEKQRASFNK